MMITYITANKFLRSRPPCRQNKNSLDKFFAIQQAIKKTTRVSCFDYDNTKTRAQEHFFYCFLALLISLRYYERSRLMR